MPEPHEQIQMIEDFLTAEEVIAEAEEYAKTKGNPVIGQLIASYYRQHGTMMPAVMRSLNLRAITITLYARKR